MEKLSVHVNYLVRDKRLEESMKKQASHRLSGNEKAFAAKINKIGRKAYFDEYFYGIPLEVQDLPQIEGITDIKATKTFQEGYKRGAFLVSIGNVPEEYQNINNSNKHR